MAMPRAAVRRLELAERWRGIQEDEEDDDGGEPSAAKHSRLIRAKEEWYVRLRPGQVSPPLLTHFASFLMRRGGRFSHCYTFLVNLPKEEHIWCGYADIMGPFLETFHGFFSDEDDNSYLRIIWRRVSQEMGICTQCVCEHHQAQGFFDTEYRSDTVDPLLKVLLFLDEERVTEHLKQINTKIQLKKYDPSCHGAEVVSIMFEVLMYPVLLDDQSLANQFQLFIETIDESYELSLSTNQQYPGVYALLFFKSCKARAIGLRLARSMGKLRRAVELEPLQPLMQKYISFLEAEVLPSTSEHSRPRVQLKRTDIWLGFKSFLGFLEAPAFEDGVLEKYPVFLNIVLNHVSDDTSDLSCAVSCLKASFEMLGCKLWLRTTLSPSVMRNTLLGHCFHTRDEKSHKEIFDLFLPFLQAFGVYDDLSTSFSLPDCPSYCTKRLHNVPSLPTDRMRSYVVMNEHAYSDDNVSSTFTWQVPNGADDGGGGKDCINTLKVSQFCALLLIIFKRLAIHVMIQIEQCGLQKQWTWEPMMGESLILALVDNNDDVRQVGRAILEHVSQARGLTSGLQFLCSSASSLSAIFLGLRYAFQLVGTRSVLADFHSFHHLFFVVCKLLKEVVAQKPPVAQPGKHSDGGFLRQPCSSMPDSLPERAVDVPNWEKFCTLLSATIWPFLSACLREGKELTGIKQCQISCVRLLDLLPLVYERININCRTQSCSTIVFQDPMDIAWFLHLIHWGKSPLLVITRHWKQCMLSLLKGLKASYTGAIQRCIEDLDNIVSHDAVDIDELEEGISNLKLALSKEASSTVKKGGSIDAPLFKEPIVSVPSPVQETHSGLDNVLNVERTKPSHSPDIHEIILLSDSEDNLPVADVSSEEVLSSVMDNDAPTAFNILKEAMPPEQRMLTDDGHMPIKPQTCSSASNIGASSRPVQKDIRGNIAASKGLDGMKKTRLPMNANNNSLLPKLVKSSVTGTSQPQRPNFSSDTEKFKSIFRDVSDDEDDPLDHALDNYRRPQIPSAKPSILVPKRQVVQLPVPVGRRQGSGDRVTSTRRLQPPKMGSWFKNILEMNYFAVVGLSSSEIVKKPALKEIPVCFDSQAQYVEIFQPLVLEEFKAQLQNAYVETPPDDMTCGCISILSVERVDEFLILRARPENSQSIKFKGCMENDLILLTKDPLKNQEQQVHVLGKVERRETDKNKALIFVIKFFLSSDNARLNKVKRLLVERSTGKTRTIVAIVSALLSLDADDPYKLSRNESMNCTDSTKPRAKISQSAAVTRAWQDAALAKQLERDSQTERPGSTERFTKGRALICAQSNAAVDELVSRLSEGLYSADGKLYRPYIVRVGNAKTVHSNSLPFFIDTLVEQRLSDELKTKNDDKNSSDSESSSSLRAKLEKVVDRIRHYESRRKLLESDKSEDGSPVPDEGEVDEVSDEALGGKLNFLYAQKRKVSAELTIAHAREKKIADENKFLKHKVRKSILGEAEIIVTTLSGCGGDIYGVCSETASSNKYGTFSEHALFDVVVIDEAAQALEPATLIPLQLLKSRGTKCIMVGDPKQLPATVMSGLASKFLYECSMFERLQRAGYPVIMLTTQVICYYLLSHFAILPQSRAQYRMHPEISRFPSSHFYENKLLDGAAMAEKSASFHDNDCLGPYMFFDVADGREHCGRNAATQSLCNEFEASAALEILTYLKNRYPLEFSSRKIGIITPYRSQLSLLRSKFTSFFGPEIVAEMEINTVDGFQGREVDILVLSTVRASNSSDDRHHTGEARSIGFVADVRRMNVALTRARLSLWIVGNARTLRSNSHWDSLVQNAQERNLFISIKRPYGLMFEKVQPHSRGTNGTTRSYHTGHLKHANNGKAAMRPKRIDAQLQKEQSTHAARNVDEEDKSLPKGQSKWASCWDQKVPRAPEPVVKSIEDSSQNQNGNMRSTKCSWQKNIDQDSVSRKQMEGKKSTVHNDNNLELSKGLVKGSSHEISSVRRRMELDVHVEQNVCKETNKALSNQDLFQKSTVRKHNNYKKSDSQNNDTGTIKGSLKHDLNLKSASKKDDVSPPAVPHLQKLIQKAKGARKLSEKPRHDNSNQVDLLIEHDEILDPANKNDGACPPTNPDIKMANKAKGTRKFSDQPRPASSNQVDSSHPSHFNEESSHGPELKKNRSTSKKDLIAERKRQREDVDSLLSSALMPSLTHRTKKKK
nr:unnamed protein product [Digitaria exilis]